MREGVAGLVRDKTRKPGLPPLPPVAVERVVALTLDEPPGETTHWTGRAMAAERRIAALGPADLGGARSPHTGYGGSSCPPIRRSRPSCATWSASTSIRRRTAWCSRSTRSPRSRRSTGPAGAADQEGRAGTMTHDYIRHGTTTLFAALNVLDGSVIGQCMARHRHQEFIRFLNRVEAAVPAGKLIHAILDNYAAHKHPKVRAWLARHPRWTFHFTPTSCSWLNAVETFFATLPAAACNAASSTRWSSSRPPSTAISPSTTGAQTVHLDRRPQPHHRKGQPRASSVGVRPLEHIPIAWNRRL